MYHVWEMDVIVMVIQTVQTMKMRPNAVSDHEMHHSSKDIGCKGTMCMYQKCCGSTPCVALVEPFRQSCTTCAYEMLYRKM